MPPTPPTPPPGASGAMNAKRKRHVGQSVVQSTMLHMALPTAAATVQPREIASARRQNGRRNQETARSLDGFMLLDCCRAEFPDEVSQAVLSGLHIKSVVAEDLLFFSNLTRLDMSDNEAPFEPFAGLPQLQELDFQCNALQHLTVPGNSFLALEVLNLSFNCLTASDVEELSQLLRVRELYLGSNWIRSLPPVMDRFSKLETLSLEHNNIGGHEIFNFLVMMPRLRNLNLGHNRITAFPESALSVDGKRGAGLYNLIYLNLVHNKIADEDDIIFTAELHSLRKLVLYGNPLTHAAVSAHDKTKLNYDPVPTLTQYINDNQRELTVVVAYPDMEKKKNSIGTYDNVDIYKMLPNEVPLPSPFRSRSMNLVAPPPENVLPKPSASAAKPKVLPVDTSDATFLTGVGIEDVLSPTGDIDSINQLPAIPPSMITRSLEFNRQTNPIKARAALNALRYQLEHPLTSHDDSDVYPISSQRLTQAQIHRQMPRHPLPPDRRRSQASSPLRSPPKKPFTTAPSPYRPLEGSRAIDDALTQLSHQVARTWEIRQQSPPVRFSTISLGRSVDNAMESLASTGQKVSHVLRPNT